jgi:short-subunit dehydrogenase involved in D-alanine esterification of teichoic acids
MKLINKSIVITGGTSGIGYEMVKRLHPNNNMIVIGRNAKKLDELSQKFKGVYCYQADLSKLDEIELAGRELAGQFPKIDVLINNAAIQFTPTFIEDDFRYETIAHEITLNFTSICSLSALLLPSLMHDKPAVILNINSGLGLSPKTSSAIYSATKGGLNIFTQALRYQLEETNVSVQQAFLELVDTGMTEGRGKNKMSVQEAAASILKGIEQERLDNDLGKVKLLRFLLRLSPYLASKIMKKA